MVEPKEVTDSSPTSRTFGFGGQHDDPAPGQGGEFGRLEDRLPLHAGGGRAARIEQATGPPGGGGVVADDVVVPDQAAHVGQEVGLGDTGADDAQVRCRPEFSMPSRPQATTPWFQDWRKAEITIPREPKWL